MLPSNGVDKFVSVQAVKACGVLEVFRHPFLTSAIDGVEWEASRPVTLVRGN